MLTDMSRSFASAMVEDILRSKAMEVHHSKAMGEDIIRVRRYVVASRRVQRHAATLVIGRRHQRHQRR